MDGDTIVALSTPPGESGIAVVRISGPEAVAILDGLVSGAGVWTPNTVHKVTMRDRGGEPVDEVLATVRRAPNSYTGEDLVEISCHGSMQVVGDLIEEIIGRGGRTAGKGEFTKRAFLNGKLDLAQAEAVADLISAETKLQRRVALEHLGGGLSAKVREIEEALLGQLVLVEVSIDFTEEEITTYDPAEVGRIAGDLRRRIGGLLESEVAGGKLRRGIRVTILGPRNAGKSSLYNALLGEERAIVSSIPGTTRDLLRERIHIGGFTYYLEDTAGIGETGCEIEEKGMSISRKAAEETDLIVFVIDGSIDWAGTIGDETAICGRGKTLFVLNKRDLGLHISAERTAGILGVERVVAISAANAEGLDELRQWIYEGTVMGETGEIARERIAVNARQGAALREADEALVRLLDALGQGAPAEILSLEIRAAAEACGKVTGRSVTDDLLDTIFSRFCIGK
ncbi:MAG: tRNA uridine-5-carboxymethylaminomethyl(34) synthesis GTPase MnmE [bacterium]|nr:MAG: tRNA uridine-5-carboxymethylaminomethyl(34) synthesis GTPase MnmE [bacterium]